MEFVRGRQIDIDDITPCAIKLKKILAHFGELRSQIPGPFNGDLTKLLDKYLQGVNPQPRSHDQDCINRRPEIVFEGLSDLVFVRRLPMI
ncbi:hypothetical protein Vi05172_g5200 [Venturia inaequalis]|nr:hypothetical protein Vi05172_g5200 [Venturia inaequalis]